MLYVQVLTPDEEPGALTKTRSCDNLTTVSTTSQEVTSNPARRSSDPNIGCGGDTMALLSKEIDSSQGRCSDGRSSGDSSDNEMCSSEEGGYMEDAGTAPQLPEEEEGGVVEKGVTDEEDRGGGGEGEACGADSSNGVKLCGGSEPSIEAGNHEHSSISQTLVADVPSGVSEGEDVWPLGNCSEELVSSPLLNGDFEGEEAKAIVMNGHAVATEVGSMCVEVDTQTSESSLMNGDTIAATYSAALDNKTFDSSTDTLIGSEDVDQALLLKSQRRLNTEHVISPVVIYQNGDGQNEHPEVDDEEERLLKGRPDLDAASVESLKLMIQKNCSISTSTTDISDSHVSSGANGVAAEVFSRAAGLGLYIRCNNGMCGMGGVGRHTPSSSEASPSVCSLVATPINSHTPPSTCSPTPGSEGKVSPLCDCCSCH